MLVTFWSIKGYGESDLLKSDDLSLETSHTNVTCKEAIYFITKNGEEDTVLVSEVWYGQSFN